MKRLKFIFLFFSFGLSFLNFRGQQIGNYINNGSFEDLKNCISFTLLDRMKYWSSADSSKDADRIFNICLGNVPGNSPNSDYQFPRTGKGYVGTTLLSPIGVRNYFKNILKSPLIANNVYCVKFYVNVRNYSPYGIDGMGAYFGDSSLDTIKYGNVVLSYLSPQVQNSSGNIITDTANWIPITGTFVATGTETQLMLGNFKSGAATNYSLINPTNGPGIGCDILFDDISCIEINLLAYAGPDKIIYPGDSTFLGRQPDFAIDPGCRWYQLPNVTTAIDTISGLWVKPSTTSTYVVRQELDCSPVKWDTVVVTVSHNFIGLNELQRLLDNITLFPNPTTEYLNISFSGPAPSDIASYFITNNLGQNIREEYLRGSSFSVSTSDLAPGLYQIHLKTQYGIVTKKFVKTN